ncbi:uncharacterized protein B0I36DRAFT_389669 [Microdochium trichocladiopsis]|uniref:Uncharacterized protein n=1 Tax=Microdochium trichocladiopsis TaxID=1682393 RepID=A0A9P8XRZ9_9PEZI|nr:uncharacterized protein B0I36DRAFT_389669 [Microdochium trichocladiopsis]KAH7012067.1 hypothetical protein B0I36DRAFT_389669 [Microdochium trichocladiopsis]
MRNDSQGPAEVLDEYAQRLDRLCTGAGSFVHRGWDRVGAGSHRGWINWGWINWGWINWGWINWGWINWGWINWGWINWGWIARSDEVMSLRISASNSFSAEMSEMTSPVGSIQGEGGNGGEVVGGEAR